MSELSFSKSRVAVNLALNLNFSATFVFYCAKLMILQCRMGSPARFEFLAHQDELKNVLTDYAAAMVAFYVAKMTTPCSPMIGPLWDTNILTSLGKVWQKLIQTKGID